MRYYSFAVVQGFNHNIRHKGKLYHVQTEDSGKENPHIITHVFVGGNILASKKTSYADIVKADRLEQIVRELMEEQHKSVLRNLINGVYDNASPEASGEAPKEPSAAPEATQVSTPKPAPQPPKAPVAPPEPVPVPQPQVAVAGGATRPAPRPANAPPQPSKERSLDEIILAYLADRDE